MVINQLVNASDYASGVGMREAAYGGGGNTGLNKKVKIEEVVKDGKVTYTATTNGKVEEATDAQIKDYLAGKKAIPYPSN
jgi:hypothetical protein